MPTRYVPILKGKAGEFTALSHASVGVRSATLPIVEAVPAGRETAEDACVSIVGNLRGNWTTIIAIDAVHLDPSKPLASGDLPLTKLATEARAAGISALPVLRLGDDPTIWAAAATEVATDGAGVVVRLAGEELQEDVADIDTWLGDLYRDVSVRPGDVDMVIDLGAVADSGHAALAGRIARDLINGLRDVPAWRSLTVAAGGFPVDLSSVPTGSTALLPRVDARLWADMRTRPLRRDPDYGDYAIQHPALPTNGGRGPAPQIRYTVGLDWRIRKGKTQQRRGHAQFYDICAALVASGEYSGVGFSWGDDQVDLAARSAPAGARPLRTTGNATTWRGIGTSHHMALVVNRLATLGAP
jgi:hypothetical protein